MLALVHKTRTSPDNGRLPGWRCRFPIWAAKRRGYCVAREIDDYVEGWWAFWLGLGVELVGVIYTGHPVSRRLFHGIAFRLTWGWLPFQSQTEIKSDARPQDAAANR